MTPTERTGERRAELYVRESLPAPAARRCERISARLDELEAEGAVATADVSTWDKRIDCDDPGSARARDLYFAFADWARERDAGLRPFFETRTCYSTATGDRGDWLVFPALCLAVYEDGDLAAVFPHADGDRYRSVSDGLDSLASSRAEPSDGNEEGDEAPVGTAD